MTYLTPTDPDDPLQEHEQVQVQPHVQLVVYAEGGVAAAYVDDVDAAAAHAQAAGGVLVELPVLADHRPADPDEEGEGEVP